MKSFSQVHKLIIISFKGTRERKRVGDKRERRKKNWLLIIFINRS
jgi:hypothetical protein